MRLGQQTINSVVCSLGRASSCRERGSPSPWQKPPGGWGRAGLSRGGGPDPRGRGWAPVLRRGGPCPARRTVALLARAGGTGFAPERPQPPVTALRGQRGPGHSAPPVPSPVARKKSEASKRGRVLVERPRVLASLPSFPSRACGSNKGHVLSLSPVSCAGHRQRGQVWTCNSSVPLLKLQTSLSRGPFPSPFVF